MRRFCAISASLLLFASLFLGCTKQPPKNDEDKKDVKADPNKVDPNKKLVVPVVNLNQPNGQPGKVTPPVVLGETDKQEKYEAALGDALTALAERKWDDALHAFEQAQSFNDSDFVKSEILKLQQRLEQDGTAKTTVKNIETVLNDGNADEAVKLASDAIKEFGDGDDAPRLVNLRLQADALVDVQKNEAKGVRFDRFSAEATAARKENNLRAEVLALELALQAKEDADLKDKYDEASARLEQYDALRKKAAELRSDSGRLDEALTALEDAAKAWDTPQVRKEVDECNLAKKKRRENLSVADFEVRNDVGMPDAGAAMAEELLLRFKAKYNLVERGQLNRVIAELKLQQDFVDEGKQQQQFADLAKVRYLVLGSVVRRTNITVNARLVDLRTGLIVQTAGIVAPTMEEALNLAPELAKQLMMTDDEKMQYDAAVNAKPAEVVPENAEVPAAPLPPAAEEVPPPAPIIDAPPPEFGAMKQEAFNELVPPPENFVAPAPVALVEQKRKRLLFAAVEVGDFLFRAGRFKEAHRQFEFALVLNPGNVDLQLRLERVRPLVPPIVVVEAQPGFIVKPRIAVLPFMVVGKLPPSLGTYTPTNLAPYFASRYEIVDPAEIYWYMGRMGLTMQDLTNDPNARRWLGRAVGVRFFVLGSCVDTTSFDVNTYLLDTELGFLQGSGKINVRNVWELKLRLAELAEMTMMTPAERQAFLAAAQHQRFVALVANGRAHMDQRRYRLAADEFELALKIYPYNVQVQTWFRLSQDQARFQEFTLATQQRIAAQQAAIAAARERQLLLAQQSQIARGRAIALAASRTDAERDTRVAVRVQARDSMITHAQVAVQTKRFGISVNLFQGALDVGVVVGPNAPPPAPVPVAVYQNFANARLQAEKAAQLREAQRTADRERFIREEREKQLAKAKLDQELERAAAKAKLDAVRAAQFKRDEDVFKAGIKQGQLYLSQDKFEPALVAFQGAQRVAHTPKQNEQVNQYIDIIVQRQAVALAKSDQAKKAIEDRLDVERKRRANMEDQYKLALQAANLALAKKDLKLAEAKFVEAKLLYKTDAVEAGFKKIQAARKEEEAGAVKAAELLKREETVKKMIADGNAAHDAKNFAAAVKAFQQAKKLDPANLAVMTGLTKAEQAHNRLLADERRKNEETGRTQNLARLVKSGRDNLDSKNYIAAIANLSEALKLNPGDKALLADLKKAQQGRDASFVDKKAQDEAKARGDKYQKLMTDGQTALDSKRFVEAIKYYSEAQKLLPGDKASLAHLQEAQTAKKAGEDAVASAATQRANEKKKAADLQKALTQGRAALAAKNFANAKKWLGDAQAINPKDADLQRALSDLAQAEAKASADAIAQKQRGANFQAALAAGKTALDAKKYAEALKALSSATTLMPENKEAQDLFRRAQAEAKQAADALANDKTRKAGFDSAVTLGKQAFQAKNYEAAIKAYQDANKLIPNDPVVQQLMKQAQNGLASAAKMSVAFQKAFDAGQAAMQGMKYAEAVNAFTTATNLDPNNASARKMLQAAQQALANANQAAINMANYQKAMTNGQTAMTAKNYLNAVSAFKDALKWMPGDQKAQTQLQAAQKALNDSMKTKPMPPDPAKLFTDAMQKATAADKAQKFGDAVKAYKEALSLRPKDAEALAGLKQSQFNGNLQQGQTYLSNAMWMQAQSEFEAALALFPGNDQAKKLLQKAKSKMK